MGFSEWLANLICGKQLNMLNLSIKRRDDEITKLTHEKELINAQISELQNQNSGYISQINTLTSDNQMLRVDNMNLESDIRLLKVPNSDVWNEMVTAAETVQGTINSALKMGLLWADPAIILQVNPDSKINNVVTDQMQIRVDEQMKHTKTTSLLKVSDKIYVFYTRY